jgi:DNA-directed RNA polymerase subunit beta
MFPKPEFSPRIDQFISPIGVFARKNVSMIKELYLGKIFYFLNENIKNMTETHSEEEILNYIVDLYEIIGLDEVTESIKKNISSTGIKKKINSGELKLFYTVTPFKSISFDKLKIAAEHLNIPLDEKVYIPETKSWTKKPVPVGVTYAQALEQTAEIYSNVRSAGKYQGLTRQATKGKSREGGQAIGGLDINCLLTYNTPTLLSELLTIRSDDHTGKREVFNSIISTGKASMPKKAKGGTKSLLWTFITSMGLKME